MAACARVGDVRLGEPPDVEIRQRAARPRAPRARSPPATARSPPASGPAPRSRRRPRARPAPASAGPRRPDRSARGATSRWTCHVRPARLTASPLVSRPERVDRLLEPGHGGRRGAQRVDRTVARADAEHRAPLRQLVEARHRAGGDDQVARQGIRDERAQPDAGGLSAASVRATYELVEDRLRIGDAQPVEAGGLGLTTELTEARERLRKKDDAEPRASWWPHGSTHFERRLCRRNPALGGGREERGVSRATTVGRGAKPPSEVYRYCPVGSSGRASPARPCGPRSSAPSRRRCARPCGRRSWPSRRGCVVFGRSSFSLNSSRTAGQ